MSKYRLWLSPIVLALSACGSGLPPPVVDPEVPLITLQAQLPPLEAENAETGEAVELEILDINAALIAIH